MAEGLLLHHSGRHGSDYAEYTSALNRTIEKGHATECSNHILRTMPSGYRNNDMIGAGTENKNCGQLPQSMENAPGESTTY